jgi:CRISPR-associated protein Cmr3
MKHLFIRPLDVLLFRDGRPFDAENDHLARSVFPPLPSVTQGMIRSRYLASKDIDLSDQAAIRGAVGTSTDYGVLRLRGPFVRKDGDLYVPVPADAYCLKADETNKYRVASAIRRPADAVSNRGNLPYLIAPPRRVEPIKYMPGLVSIRELRKHYLSERQGDAFEDIPAKSVYVTEMRYGNGIVGSRKAVDTGKLYQVGYIRLSPGAGLHLDVVEHWSDWTETSGISALGGESRLAAFEESPIDAAAAMPEPPTRIEQAPNVMQKPQADGVIRFKLLLTTPGYFEDGWQPRGGDWTKHFDGPGVSSVKLAAAAVTRAVSMGGFDQAQRKHKPAVRYVPAGSVYYFEAGQPVVLRRAWLTDAQDDNELGHIGFGQVLAGGWSPAS